MAELGIITMLAKTPKKAAFTAEQITRIYEHSGRSTDTAALRAAARELFPEILQNNEPPLTCSPASGRWFLVEDEYVAPTHMIITNRALMVGVLPDGTLKEY